MWRFGSEKESILCDFAVKTEVASDAIYGADVEYVGLDIHEKNVVILGQTTLKLCHPLTS